MSSGQYSRIADASSSSATYEPVNTSRYGVHQPIMRASRASWMSASRCGLGTPYMSISSRTSSQSTRGLRAFSSRNSLEVCQPIRAATASWVSPASCRSSRSAWARRRCRTVGMWSAISAAPPVCWIAASPVS